jgi:hypothetical protein
MSDNRAGDAYRFYADARVRFDYFITGGAGVVLAFSLKEFSAANGPIGIWLLPVAWVLLLVALAAGLFALNSFVELMRLGVEKHRHRDAQGVIRSALIASQTEHVIETHTGIPISHATGPRLLELHSEAEKKADQRADREATMELWAVRVRNVSLVTALGVIALWRWVNL